MASLNLRQQLQNRHLHILKGGGREKEESLYVPLSLKALMAGEVLPFTLLLKVSKAGGQEIDFLPFVEAGARLHREDLGALGPAGIDRGYFHTRDLETVIAYLNNHLLLTDDWEGMPQRLCLLREHLGLSMRLAFASPHLGKHIAGAQKMLEEVVGFMEKDPISWEFLGEILFSDYSLYSHSVNVALLAMAYTGFLKKGQDDCLLLGLAGLLHDVGMTQVASHIIYTVEPLSRDDWEAVRGHPGASHRLLLDTSQTPEAVQRLVLEHHEHADGSGYPQGLNLGNQHPLSRVLHLMDAYDALTSHRPYRRALKPFAALKILQEQRGARGPAYDPATLTDFIRFLAII